MGNTVGGMHMRGGDDGSISLGVGGGNNQSDGRNMALAQQQQQQQGDGVGSVNDENRKVLEWIAQMMRPETRESALLELSKKREQVPELALILWYSFGETVLKTTGFTG